MNCILETIYAHLKKNEIKIISQVILLKDHDMIISHNLAVAIFKVLNDKRDRIDMLALRKLAF